jgi:RNA polymerase sigma-70 factor (ECF subfamily)
MGIHGAAGNVVSQKHEEQKKRIMQSRYPPNKTVTIRRPFAPTVRPALPVVCPASAAGPQMNTSSCAIQTFVYKETRPALYYDERRMRGTHGTVERYAFNQQYIERLADGDPEVGRHFADYFGEMLLLKLRYRLRNPQAVEDLRQETFVRIFRAIQKKDGIVYPERFGAFVNSVCENVLLEYFRSGKSTFQMPENGPDPVDRSRSAESEMIVSERRRLVEKTLASLPEKDRKVLRGIYLEEKDKDQLCEELNISRNNLRIRVHRALERFRLSCREDERLSRASSVLG